MRFALGGQSSSRVGAELSMAVMVWSQEAELLLPHRSVTVAVQVGVKVMVPVSSPHA
jgi:hypothetical protein